MQQGGMVKYDLLHAAEVQGQDTLTARHCTAGLPPDLPLQIEELKVQNRALLERVIRACPTPPVRGQAVAKQMRRTRSGTL